MGGGGCNQNFIKTLMGEFFSTETLVGGDKKGDSMFCGSSVGGTCQGLSNFPWSVAITFSDPQFTEHKLSDSFCHILCHSYMSWLIIIWSTFLYLSCFFLAAHPQASIAFLLYTIWRSLRIKKNFMAPFYGWASSRLQPLWGGSLLFSLPFSSQKFLVLIS